MRDQMGIQDTGWLGRALVLSGSGKGKVAGSCDHGDEPSRSIECL